MTGIFLPIWCPKRDLGPVYSAPPVSSKRARVAFENEFCLREPFFLLPSWALKNKRLFWVKLGVGVYNSRGKALAHTVCQVKTCELCFCSLHWEGEREKGLLRAISDEKKNSVNFFPELNCFCGRVPVNKTRMVLTTAGKLEGIRDQGKWGGHAQFRALSVCCTFPR